MDLDQIIKKMKNGEALTDGEVSFVVDELDNVKDGLAENSYYRMDNPELAFGNKAAVGLFEDLLGQSSYNDFIWGLARADRQSIEKLIRSYGTIKENNFLISNIRLLTENFHRFDVINADMAAQMEHYVNAFYSDAAWDKRMSLTGITDPDENFYCELQLKKFMSPDRFNPLILWPEPDNIWQAFGKMSNHVHLDDIHGQGILLDLALIDDQILSSALQNTPAQIWEVFYDTLEHQYVFDDIHQYERKEFLNGYVQALPEFSQYVEQHPDFRDENINNRLIIEPPLRGRYIPKDYPIYIEQLSNLIAIAGGRYGTEPENWLSFSADDWQAYYDSHFQTLNQTKGRLQPAEANSIGTLLTEEQLRSLPLNTRANLIGSFSSDFEYMDNRYIHTSEQRILSTMSMPGSLSELRKQYIGQTLDDILVSAPFGDGNIINYLYENWHILSDEQFEEIGQFITDRFSHHANIAVPIDFEFTEENMESPAQYHHYREFNEDGDYVATNDISYTYVRKESYLDEDNRYFSYKNISFNDAIGRVIEFVSTALHEANHGLQSDWQDQYFDNYASRPKMEDIVHRQQNVENAFNSQLEYDIYVAGKITFLNSLVYEGSYSWGHNAIELDSGLVEEQITDPIIYNMTQNPDNPSQIIFGLSKGALSSQFQNALDSKHGIPESAFEAEDKKQIGLEQNSNSMEGYSIGKGYVPKK